MKLSACVKSSNDPGVYLAKIGSVFLHQGQGRWQDKQIVPAEWVELSMQRHVENNGSWSRGGIWGYGFQWWHGQFDNPVKFTVIAGMGHGGQRLFIVPEEKIVVTIFAGQYSNHTYDGADILGQIISAHRDGGATATAN